MSGPRLRAVLAGLAGYQPTDGLYSGATRVRPLSANESPDGPLPGIVAAIAASAAAVNRYPDPGCAELTRRIADTHGVPADAVAVGAGSVALLQVLMQAVAEPGAEVVYAWRSFELYPVLADLAGVRSVRVPLTGYRHDLRAMAESITDHTRLVILCNPNNPTGTPLAEDELRRFLADVPPTCLVALDEAYHEYVREPTTSSGIGWCAAYPNPAAHPNPAAYPNLVVLRTFSKAYGLAGLRVGYLVGAPGVVGRLRKACLAYSVNAPAQDAAAAALGLAEELTARVDATVAERTRVRDALLAGGWDVPRSEANFLWLPLHGASAGFGRRCADAGIAVRTFPDEGVRVSVGSPEDNDAFLAVAARWRTRE
jgi:histidinol-phosphate aminotransferase